MKRTHITVGLLVSLVLHGLLFAVLDKPRNWRLSTVHPTLDLTLQTQIRSLEPESAETAFDEPELNSDEWDAISSSSEALPQFPLTQTPPPKAQDRDNSESSAPPPVTTTTLQLPDARELVSQLATTENRTAFQAYVQPECDKAEQASLARVCDPYDEQVLQLSMTDAASNTLSSASVILSVFEAAFRRLSTTRRDFNKDMQRVEQLVTRRATLSSLNPQDPVQVALVAEQRRELRDQIMRIDKKYTEANLLRLIPISRKVLKGLQDIGTGSK
ncbi:MAG: hypothetical protein RIC89_03445 [Pseudomonadales bacterium]